MTTTILHSLPLYILPLFVGLFAKSTFLLLLAALACRLLRRSSAATRHLVWTAAVISVLLLPLISAALPKWNVAWGHTAATSPAAPLAVLDLGTAKSAPQSVEATSDSSSSVPTPADAVPASVTDTTEIPTPVSHRRIPAVTAWSIFGLALWLGGTLVSLAYLAVGLSRIGRIGRRAMPLEGGAFQVAEAAREQIGLRRHVQFLRADVSNAVTVPVTWGVLRPVVLLPMQSAAWSEECLRAAFLHELAHVQRGDWPTQLLSRLACALYWWHPLVWWATRQARAESERACDNLVLGTGMKAADYALRLIEVVRSMPLGRADRTLAVTMAQPSEVEGRVREVLAAGISRRPLTRRRILGSCILALLLILPLAVFRLTPAAQAQDTARTDPQGGERETLFRETYADGNVTIRNGDRAKFPNGYEVSLVAVTQATRTGNEWDMYGGPWWRPDGTPIAPQSGGLNGHEHWTAAATHGLSPFSFKISIQPPGHVWQLHKGNEISFFEEFPASLKPNDNPHSHTLADGSSPEVFDGFVSGTRPANLYPAGTRSCTVRCGVAAGPWQTVSRLPFTLTPASVSSEAFLDSPLSSTAHDLTDVSLSQDDRPRETYLDTRGKRHVFYFLGSAGRLTDVARRFVAVDRAGRVIPLNKFGVQHIALAFSRNSDVTKRNPTLDLAKVKEFRLQTCSYLTVEFRNVQLQPALAAGGDQDAAATLLAQAGTQQFEQARQLRGHLQDWAASNRTLLQRMTHAQPGDLSTLMAVYESLQRLPFPLWNGDPRLANGSEDAQFTIGLPSRLTLTHLQRSQELVETRMRRDFAEFHDLAVSQSQEVGAVHLTLWASGRITQTTARDQFMGHGKLLRTAGSEQEVMPAFFEDKGTSSTGGVVAHATTEAPKSLPGPTKGLGADSAHERQSQRAIRAAYATGFGRMGIMNIPQAWHPDKLSYRTALHLIGLTISGKHAIGRTKQEDSVTLIDPATGQSHQATAEAVFEGSWDETPRGWLGRSFRPLSIIGKIDGKPLTIADGKLKTYGVPHRAWPPLPPSYPYWK